ncbi:hypothetical protein PPL_04430 [Heterostelium album PN500]|uniref:Uncharacterized protein n=1 Tax=Heterostelium pallidum (strain ATCC 26659 / Pp 5 / PN500) TaxID=670386 RepID=D3B7J2_HETP5|nr:hypothetical protein PPL_04430 [Heterostelium album PN500]EFA82735.1 hypothetical protein PPL_04430 [Heterostelium album PN500]|eukprot:XP_020434852.1 hypothetical protein PPL_04430 [Heterostelium album PN500]
MNTIRSSFQKLFPRLGKVGQRTYEGYINALHNRPVLTKAITTGTLYFVSDTMSQYIENRGKTDWLFDYKRAMRIQRVLFMNLINLGWAAFLSSQSQSAH